VIIHRHFVAKQPHFLIFLFSTQVPVLMAVVYYECRIFVVTDSYKLKN